MNECRLADLLKHLNDIVAMIRIPSNLFIFLFCWHLCCPSAVLDLHIPTFCVLLHSFPFSYLDIQFSKNNPFIEAIVAIYVTESSPTMCLTLTPFFCVLLVSSWYFLLVLLQSKLCTLLSLSCKWHSKRKKKEELCLCDLEAFVCDTGWILRQREIRCLHLNRLFPLADYSRVINGNPERDTNAQTQTQTEAYKLDDTLFDPTRPRKGRSCINTKIVHCFPYFSSRPCRHSGFSSTCLSVWLFSETFCWDGCLWL